MTTSSTKKKPPGDDDSSFLNCNEMDEKQFLRVLAEALRTKEEEEALERDEIKLQWSNANQRNKSSSGSNATNDSKIQSAYRELCHDDPIVTGGDRVCRQLAEVLIPKRKTTVAKSIKNDNDNPSKLALSSPLVGGVLHAVGRAGSKASANASSSTSTQPNNNDNNDNQQQEESIVGFSNFTSSEGYAQLAFAIFLEGPYRCIQQADDLNVTCQFLGSFQPPEKINSPTAHYEELNAEEKSRFVEEATAKIVDGIEKMSKEGEDCEKDATEQCNDRDDDASSSSSEFFLRNKNNNRARRVDDDDSMEEIFAEESDPDDYEYETSYNPYNETTCNVGNNYDYFNPTKLSKPNSRSCEDARRSIYYLLSSFSYANMALNTLSSRAWSDLGMSESCADLAFTLLLAHTNGSHDINSLLCQNKDKSVEGNVDDITTLWDRPLFALRDRAMDSNRGHDALSLYLQLICAFLSYSEDNVMSILSPPSKDANNSNDLPPLTAVGLSCFATLCSSKEMTCSFSAKSYGTPVESICPRDEVKNAILNSIDTLAHIIECARPKKSTFGSGYIRIKASSDNNSKTESWVRTTICIIPMMEYLINIQARFDFQRVFEGGGSQNSILTDSDAKTLLNSGLFRELILLYTCTQDEKSVTENVVRLQLLRTIFALSVQSPEVLGRYVVRVPDLVKEVYASNFMEEKLVDGVLWTALGLSLMESKLEAPTPKLKLRTNTKLNAPVDTCNLAERCCAGFEHLCKSSNTALISFKEVVDRENDDDDNEARTHKESLGDIVKFSNYLSNCPHGIKIWLDSMNSNEDAPQNAKVALADLRSTLARLPSCAEEAEVSKHDHKKDDDNERESTNNNSEIRQKATSLKQRRKDFGKIVSLVRSSVKVIALALESQKGAGLSLKTPMTSYNASSKTD